MNVSTGYFHLLRGEPYAIVGVMPAGFQPLWGVTPNDPATIVGVAAALIGMAAIATVVPAIRILRLNPADTLRAE